MNRRQQRVWDVAYANAFSSLAILPVPLSEVTKTATELANQAVESLPSLGVSCELTESDERTIHKILNGIGVPSKNGSIDLTVVARIRTYLKSIEPEKMEVINRLLKDET